MSNAIEKARILEQQQKVQLLEEKRSLKIIEQRRNYIIREIFCEYFPIVMMLEPTTQPETTKTFKPVRDFLSELSDVPCLQKKLSHKISTRKE